MPGTTQGNVETQKETEMRKREMLRREKENLRFCLHWPQGWGVYVS